MNQQSDDTRRIAVILGPGGGSRYLLDRLQPLLATNRDIEMQGIFLEEAGVKHAAELPFVNELCRVTFSVREFDSEQFERALALRMRTARQALTVLAKRTGTALTFRNVRGSDVSLLQQAVGESDITVFEPARPRVAETMAPSSGSKQQGWVAALLSDPESSAQVLNAAVQLAGGDQTRVAVLLRPDGGGEIGLLRAFFRGSLPGFSGHVRVINADDFNDLALSVRELLASVLVVPATEQWTGEKGLSFLRRQIRCPVCVVRDWGH